MALSDPTNIGNRPGDGPLRAGGATLSDAPGTDGNLPSTLSPAAKKQAAATERLRDVVRGTATVRERSTVYLPQAAGEGPQNYKERLQRAVFFNVTARTVEGLVGQVFRKDPLLGDDVPVEIAGDEESGIPGHLENIDNAGTHFDVFARDILQDALTVGHAAILVEYPATGGEQKHSQERQGEIRPYWVPIRKEDILSWRTAVENGKTVLTQIVLRECQSVAAGAFGEMERTRYRVFARVNGVVSFRLLEINENKQVVEVANGDYPTQTEIPIAEIPTSGRCDLFESTPPLEDLAFLNVAHYQMWSDYATSIYKTCVPIYCESGIAPDDTTGAPAAIVLGPNSARRETSPDFKSWYTAHDGAALESVKHALDDLKADMGTMGIAMLAPQKRSAETATAHRQDKSTEDSALAVTARGLQDGLERALDFHARYLKLDDGGSVTINREFDEQRMQADMLTAWTGAVSNAKVPERYMLADMQLGNLIPPSEDVDAIADEMAANAAAAAEQEAQRLQDAAAMKQQQVVPPKAA